MSHSRTLSNMISLHRTWSYDKRLCHKSMKRPFRLADAMVLVNAVTNQRCRFICSPVVCVAVGPYGHISPNRCSAQSWYACRVVNPKSHGETRATPTQSQSALCCSVADQRKIGTRAAIAYFADCIHSCLFVVFANRL